MAADNSSEPVLGPLVELERPRSYATVMASPRTPTTEPPVSTPVDVPLHQFEFGSMNMPRTMLNQSRKASFNGMPSLSFTDTEVENLSKTFNLTLVGKFSHGIPKIFEVTQMLKDLKLKSSFTVSFMDKRHIAIKLFIEEDYNRLWLIDNPNVLGIPFRLFEWTSRFSLEDELPIVPIWVSLENLPLFLFHKEALYEIGSC